MAIFVVVVALLAAIAAGAFAHVYFKRYLREREEYNRVRALFSRYVSPQVVDDLLERHDPRLFEAREYYATILCARIRNFALVAESLSPEHTLRYLNEFYTIVGQAVQRNRGMIETLRGDTVFAVFGVLVEETFQEERALRAALDIVRLADAMERRWKQQNRKPLFVSVGVNSGKIVAGDTGFQHRREFAVIGNPATVASRLQTAAEEINALIVASEDTYNPVRDLFVGLPASSLPLRGLKRLQNAYLIRGLSNAVPDDPSLTLPSERAFKQTVVVAQPPPDAVEPDAYIAPAEEAVPTGVVVDGFGRIDTSRLSQLDDDAPAMPELPVISGTYEDEFGPPFRLNP